MTTKSKSKIKTQAKVLVCQNQDEVQDCIKKLGDSNREIERLQANMNDEIAIITQKYAQMINPIKTQADDLTQAIQIWCEANKDSLLTKGSKTVNLITGEVSWRIRPPSVVVRGIGDVISRFERFGLDRFIRIQKTINKEAILSEPDAVTGIAGISIKTGVEDFIITPFEAETAS